MKIIQNNLNRFVVQKFITYKLHIGSLKSLWNPRFKPFLNGFRNNFCIINPELSVLYLKRAYKILQKIHLSNKKILFIGSPVGLEKEFSCLCIQNNHYFMEKGIYGFFSNYENKASLNIFNTQISSKQPDVIFIFNPSLNLMVFEETKGLDIPIISFVSTDDDYFKLDYPIPANIKSKKGGLFVYNLFHYLFTTKVRKFSDRKIKSRNKIDKY
ncbi:40S ribosomal protein S2 (mitochondrion) [Nannochloropsis gaditana]|uniref:30S ribosomal protein S2 n=1 Tax=Nannochloropsis gaditana TaxID=72520 RepID=K9ZVD7_9STRA|nr:40S ribosomal protein S2 [Nannochloropsis gaditana]AFZ64349.1 40S ribosomal protein S2 [Nannochloropsis gaditana]AGI49050.1 40S ribosomal protein S2 [Nannochloropsis gaditana]AHX24904.1 30S ribosomal protein S2 [Nannochloropsis gaditana]